MKWRVGGQGRIERVSPGCVPRSERVRGRWRACLFSSRSRAARATPGARPTAARRPPRRAALAAQTERVERRRGPAARRVAAPVGPALPAGLRTGAVASWATPGVRPAVPVERGPAPVGALRRAELPELATRLDKPVPGAERRVPPNASSRTIASRSAEIRHGATAVVRVRSAPPMRGPAPRTAGRIHKSYGPDPKKPSARNAESDKLGC